MGLCGNEKGMWGLVGSVDNNMGEGGINWFVINEIMVVYGIMGPRVLGGLYSRVFGWHPLKWFRICQQRIGQSYTPQIVVYYVTKYWCYVICPSCLC